MPGCLNGINLQLYYLLTRKFDRQNLEIGEAGHVGRGGGSGRLAEGRADVAPATLAVGERSQSWVCEFQRVGKSGSSGRDSPSTGGRRTWQAGPGGGARGRAWLDGRRRPHTSRQPIGVMRRIFYIFRAGWVVGFKCVRIWCKGLGFVGLCMYV